MSRKSLIFQFMEILIEMQAFGESKHQDKINNNGKPDLLRIYSYSTFTVYKFAVIRFANRVRTDYGCKTPTEARPYVAAYLQSRIDAGLSAWTIHLEASALAKVYHCSYLDFGVALPQRLRRDIRRNLSTSWSRAERYALLVAVCKSIGLRRHELRKLRVEDVVVYSDTDIWVYVRQGKGGRRRWVRALDDSIVRARDLALAEGREKVFASIPSDAPTHGYRRVYAQRLYAIVARDVSTLGRQEVYRCRAEMTGVVFDRRAMQIVSQNLGHNRLGVVVTYLRSVDS